MNSKTARIGLFVLIIAALGVGLSIPTTQSTQKRTEVYMFDVGQGDSFFIETSTGKQMLIDAGKDATVLLELAHVMPWSDKSIDIVLATHTDMDNIGGLD